MRSDPNPSDVLGPIVVAVLTYKRPEDLPALLPQLLEQTETVGEDVTVLVVDNDAEESARVTVAALALDRVTYVVEPRPGIAAARNRALAEVPHAHLLIFIDDDERPEPGWLSALLDCYRRERSAAVAGPVVPDAVGLDDPWIVAGGFFVRKRHPTGTEVEAASTANLLLDLRQLAELGAFRFDEKFSLTGGSDTLFTRRLTRAGGRIVWCDEASVVDHIRIQRLNRRWVLQRHFRAGNSWSRTTVELEPGPLSRLGVRLRLTVLGLVRIVLGSLRAAFGTVTRSLRHQARGSRTAARGTGMVLGAWGGVYIEYRRKDAAAS